MLKINCLMLFTFLCLKPGNLYANKLTKCMEDFYAESRDRGSNEEPSEALKDESFKEFYQSLAIWNRYLSLRNYSNFNSLSAQEKKQIRKDFQNYRNSEGTKKSIKERLYAPLKYDYALNKCHYKRRTNKMQKRFEDFKKLKNIKNHLPLNLKEKIVKTGYSRGLGSLLRTRYLLGRRDGVWVLRKAIKFSWPISLNPLSKLKNKADISIAQAKWMGIDKDPRYCGKINTTDKHRDVKRGTFIVKTSKGGSFSSCRLKKDEIIKGKPVRAWIMDFWKKTIEDYYFIPGYFKTEIVIINRYDKPNRVDRELKKKYRKAIWRVGLSRVVSKRAMAFHLTQVNRSMYIGLKPSTIIHEFGHSLSFIDEYSEQEGSKICDSNHIMCSSSALDSKAQSRMSNNDIVYVWNIIKSYPFGKRIKSAKRLNRARSDVAEAEEDIDIINIGICKEYIDSIPKSLDATGKDSNKQYRSLCMGVYNEKCITNKISHVKTSCNFLQKASSKMYALCPYCPLWRKGTPLVKYEINLLEDISSISQPTIKTSVASPLDVEQAQPSSIEQNRKLIEEAQKKEYEFKFDDIHPPHVNLFRVQSNRIQKYLSR